MYFKGNSKYYVEMLVRMQMGKTACLGFDMLRAFIPPPPLFLDINKINKISISESAISAQLIFLNKQLSINLTYDLVINIHFDNCYQEFLIKSKDNI